MPSCWFLLNKQYLRVDGVIVRTRETRLFHKFDDNCDVNNNSDNNNENNNSSKKIFIEITWREYLKGTSNNNQLEAYLQNRDLIQQTHVLPIVNEVEGIKNYFVLEFKDN